MVTEKQGRVAAWVAAAMFVLVAGVQFAWELSAVLDGGDAPSASDQLVAVTTGLLALVAAAVLLVRVGYWRAHVSFEVGRVGAWWVAYLSLGGALAGFAGQMGVAWFIAGPGNLVLGVLALVVARSALPGSLATATSPPGVRPGSAKPAH